MAEPSNLPSAQAVAAVCFDRYKENVDPNVSSELRDDLNGMADHVLGLGQLESVWIRKLVPWEEFLRRPNGGHAAIADFLIVRATVAALSGNYDCLIEQSGRGYGFDFEAAIDGDQATIQASKQGPLLKLHGCSQIARSSTIWTESQLMDEITKERLTNIETWMASNLRQKDLLIVGFWTDWSYLNGVLEEAVKGVSPVSVTVIDPCESDELAKKAPVLWSIAHAPQVVFEHIRISGVDALEDLRRAFSRMYLSKVISAGKSVMEQESGEDVDPTWLQVDEEDNEALYEWRRDVEGKPRSQAATKIEPTNADQIGFFHLLLLRAGGERSTRGYVLAGQTVRVVNGAGLFLSQMRASFAEAPALEEEDVVVAVGAMDVGLPSNVVRQGNPRHIVRPESGARWLDFESAREELQI